MADKITWADKESLVTDPTIAEINKVTDDNMNEIKSVTNTNADELTEKIVYDEDDITENTGLIIEEVPEGSNIPYINSEIDNEYGTATNRGYAQAYINKFIDYSTEEQVIGKWINGKPIYRKVIIYGTMPTGAEDSPTVNHNIANIDLITRWYGFCVNNAGLQYNFDHVAAINMGSNMTIATRINKQWVQVAVNNDMSAFTGYFVIEYTKTTD